MAFTSDDIAILTGAPVLDADRVPSWATVRTGFLGSSESCFPLERLQVGLQVTEDVRREILDITDVDGRTR